jgi:hypothetical protein
MTMPLSPSYVVLWMNEGSYELVWVVALACVLGRMEILCCGFFAHLEPLPLLPWLHQLVRGRLRE